MSTTPLLGITELEANQAQPEVIINEALRKLEAMSPLQAHDKDLTAPPGSPADGDRYIVPTGATGDWAGPNQFAIALLINGTWHFLTPIAGWVCYVEDEDLYYQFTPGSPTGWVAMP
jgi:hypothetical protein